VTLCNRLCVSICQKYHTTKMFAIGLREWQFLNKEEEKKNKYKKQTN
jgi:hypothetical protein